MRVSEQSPRLADEEERAGDEDRIGLGGSGGVGAFEGVMELEWS